jgi:hypothetical protein
MPTRDPQDSTGITTMPTAPPTANLPTGTSSPQTPGVARPTQTPQGPQAPSDRSLPARFVARLIRMFGLPTDYRADIAERVIPMVLVADLTKPQVDDPTHQGADYKVFSVSLAAALNRTPIDGTKDMSIAIITIVNLTALATAQLHIGDQDPIDIGGTGLAVGTTFIVDPPIQSFIAVTAAAQAGATLKLMVSAGMRLG